MFDMSFSELMIAAVIALIVIGPEKLPKVARTVGAFAGRLQRYISDVKEEINRESRFEELQALQQEISGGVQTAESSIRTGIDELVDAVKPNELIKKSTKKQVTEKANSSNLTSKKVTQKKSTVKSPSPKKLHNKKPTTKSTVSKKLASKKPVAKKTIVAKTRKAKTPKVNT